VKLVDIHLGKVYLYFGGGCQGCSQASVTVKQGIEKLLLKEFPELTGVEDITNHSAGTNPYFK
jgi:Fe/S biogenesis protein NfuA